MVILYNCRSNVYKNKGRFLTRYKYNESNILCILYYILGVITPKICINVVYILCYGCIPIFFVLCMYVLFPGGFFPINLRDYD